MKIGLAVLNYQFELYQSEYEEDALRALRSGWYVFGPEAEVFEGDYETDYMLPLAAAQVLMTVYRGTG